MNICVYGAAGSGIEEKFFRLSEELGKKLAARGHSLVFGGGSTGVMGSVVKGILSSGGTGIGVAPHFFQQLYERVIIAIGVPNDNGLGVSAQLLEREDLEKFVHRAYAAGSDYKGIGKLL